MKQIGAAQFKQECLSVLLIAATSIVHRLPLVTPDRVIRKSRRVPLVR